MCLTIEPGISIEGVGGFRHSDTVLIGDEGPVQLTGGPLELGALTFPVRVVVRRHGRNTERNPFHRKATPRRLQELPTIIFQSESNLNDCVRTEWICVPAHAQTFYFDRFERIMTRTAKQKLQGT